MKTKFEVAKEAIAFYLEDTGVVEARYSNCLWINITIGGQASENFAINPSLVEKDGKKYKVNLTELKDEVVEFNGPQYINSVDGNIEPVLGVALGFAPAGKENKCLFVSRGYTLRRIEDSYNEREIYEVVKIN